MDIKYLLNKKLEPRDTGVRGVEVGGQGVRGLNDAVKNGKEGLCVS